MLQSPVLRQETGKPLSLTQCRFFDQQCPLSRDRKREKRIRTGSTSSPGITKRITQKACHHNLPAPVRVQLMEGGVRTVSSAT
jgi:hypothetical protein